MADFEEFFNNDEEKSSFKLPDDDKNGLESLRPRYCALCKTTYLGKYGEIFHQPCEKIKDFGNQFVVTFICDTCYTPLYRSLPQMFINRPYYPTGCLKEMDWYKSYHATCCHHKDCLVEKDIEEFNKAMNTRIIWHKSGNYTIEVIDDPKEREEIDRQFYEYASKVYPKVVKLNEHILNEYDKILKKRLDNQIRNLLKGE